MATKGLLLINLGSPASPSRRDVKKYLGEFLMDPFVIDIATPLRMALVHGIITPLRSGKSAKAYQSIWTKDGSPLVNFTRLFAEGVKHRLRQNWDVRWAMRYGAPAIGEVVQDWPVDEIYIVPLYPQYAESSSRTAIDRAVARIHKASGGAKKIHILRDFYGEVEFIEAQAALIKKHVDEFAPDQLLLSFHGLPEHHLTKLHEAHCLVTADCCNTVTARNRNCYRAQALFTASALRTHLPLNATKIKVGFQSRLGRRPWIKPYTDLLITELAAQGVKRILVSCPSFVADCLETLEEIQIRLREQFLSEGGQELKLIPALNAEPNWIERFSAMIERSSLQWTSP